MLIVWVPIGLALALALLSLAGDRAKARFAAERLASPRLPDEACEAATVIVPVKGFDEGLAENLAALAALDYPDYELIIAARAPGDLAAALPARARLVIADDDGDEARSTGEKILNLLAAVRAARPESRVLAFADSDGRVSAGWLRALVAGLGGDREAGASTGYRWHIPPVDRAGFWPQLRSAWNAVIAGGFGPGNNGFAWGGAMAIRRETFVQARVADYWRGAVSDDFRLAEAIHDAGLKIAFAPGAMVAARDSTTAAEFGEWIARQMKITRAYRPRLWWLGLISHIVYCWAMAAALWHGAILAFAAQAALGALKGRNRAAIARACFPDDAAWFRRYNWIYVWWGPLVTWVWLYSFLASAGSRRIRWRGREYVLRYPGKPGS